MFVIVMWQNKKKVRGCKYFCTALCFTQNTKQGGKKIVTVKSFVQLVDAKTEWYE